MKIDFTIDFDALLEEAKAKRKEHDDVIDKWRHTWHCKELKSGRLKMGYPPKVDAIIHKSADKWEQWVKTNIHDRGLELLVDMHNRPTAITAVLTGTVGD